MSLDSELLVDVISTDLSYLKVREGGREGEEKERGRREREGGKVGREREREGGGGRIGEREREREFWMEKGEIHVVRPFLCISEVLPIPFFVPPPLCSYFLPPSLSHPSSPPPPPPSFSLPPSPV